MLGPKYISKASVFTILLIVTASSAGLGCSGKSKTEERAAIDGFKAASRRIPKVTEEELKYCNETGRITTVEAKLITDKTPENAKETREQIEKPAIFIEEYLQDHPQTPEGAQALQQIAKAYQTIDTIIGDQEEQIAKAQNLIVSLYPDSPEADEAQMWLKNRR